MGTVAEDNSAGLRIGATNIVTLCATVVGAFCDHSVKISVTIELCARVAFLVSFQLQISASRSCYIQISALCVSSKFGISILAYRGQRVGCFKVKACWECSSNFKVRSLYLFLDVFLNSTSRAFKKILDKDRVVFGSATLPSITVQPTVLQAEADKASSESQSTAGVAPVDDQSAVNV